MLVGSDGGETQIPFISRDWWLSLAAKGYLLLGIVGAVLAIAAVALGLWSTFHTLQTPPDNGPPVLSTVASTWLFCGCILLLGVTWSALAFGRRKLLRNRLAALRGNQDAMSLARVTGHPQLASDVSTHALQVVWPARIVNRPFVAILRVGISWLAAVTVPLAIVLAFETDVIGAHKDVGWLLALLLSGIAINVTGGPWASAVATLGTARRMAAAEVGIVVDRVLGRPLTMQWTDMRLLEVAKVQTFTNSDSATRFTLYGKRRTFRWRDRIDLNSTATRSQQLLDVIAAETGLVPRTGNATLKRLEGPWRFASLLSLPAVAMQREQNDSQRRFGDPQYSFVWCNYSPQARLIAGLTGVLLIAADTVAVLWILAAVGVRQLDGVPTALPWFNGIWAFFVLLFGIVGVPLLIGALRRERPSWLLADSFGLHLHSFDRTRSISWIAITDVSVPPIGRRRTYVVADASSPMFVGWPARPRPWEGPSPVPESVPLAPSAMAELAVERTGKER